MSSVNVLDYFYVYHLPYKYFGIKLIEFVAEQPKRKLTKIYIKSLQSSHWKIFKVCLAFL